MDYAHAVFTFVAITKLCDALVVAFTWLICWYLRFGFLPTTKGIPSTSDYHQLAPVIALIYVVVFHLVGGYRRDRIFFGFRSLKKIVEGSVLGLMTFVSILYFENYSHISRFFLLLFPALAISTILIERLLLQLGWNYYLRHHIKKLDVLLVGTGEVLQYYVHKVLADGSFPIHWVGWLHPKEVPNEYPLPVRLTGNDDDLYETIRNEKPDLVLVSYPTKLGSRLESVLRMLSNELVNVRVLPDFGKYNTFTYSAANDFGVPAFVLNQAATQTSTSGLVFKRIFDIIGASLLLVLSLPLYLVVGLLIKLTSRGPIFYSQVRVGADGKVFTIYKFRTMRMDAEKKSGPVWATQDDDRTTRIGKFLRRKNLDEFPQFFNVLKGDMSLVGPRPERPHFVEKFRDQVPKYMLRHKMKSGITGWAQVNGWRGNTSLEERIKHDLFYIGNWSHFLDIKILCMTCFKSFSDHHAY